MAKRIKDGAGNKAELNQNFKPQTDSPFVEYKGQPGHFTNPLPSTIPKAIPDKKDGHEDLKWWTKPAKSEDQNTSITDTIFNIRLFQVSRFNQMALSSRLYGNRGLNAMFSNGKTGAMRLVKSPNMPPDRLQFNLTCSAIDTVHSKMVKNKPSPMFLTTGGTYRQHRKARKLTRFCEAVFHEGKVHVKGAECFRFAAIHGDCFMHVFKHPFTGRIAFELVPAPEILVDEIEACHGEPRQMHRVKNVDRGMLLELDGLDAEAKERIIGSDIIQGDSGTTPMQVSDTIELRESWHLPSSPEAKDGFHCLSVSKGVIWAEKWTESWFPFAKLAWSKPLLGYYGTSAAQQIQGQQMEVNKLLWLESTSIHMMGTFKIAVPLGSNIIPEHLHNGIGSQIKYAGDKAPQYLTPQAFHEQVPQMLQDVKASAFEQLGVSMLSAQSKKPEGLDSGSAIREYNYIETDRFFSKGADYEQFYMDIADLTIKTARKICEEDGGYEVKHFGADLRYIRQVDFKELMDLEEDDYAIQCFPVSSLPDEPSGRMQKVQEYVQAGWMTPARGRRLLNYPDVEADELRANAMEEYFFKIFDQMVDGKARNPMDDFTPPDPLDNLDLGSEMCLQEYQLAKTYELKEARLQLLRDWMDQVDALKTAAMPPAPPPGMPPPGAAGGGTPQGQPPVAPQSDLLPQTGG